MREFYDQEGSAEEVSEDELARREQAYDAAKTEVEKDKQQVYAARAALHTALERMIDEVAPVRETQN